MNMSKWLQTAARIYFALLISISSALAQSDPVADLLQQKQQFLSVDQAFQFDFRQHGSRLLLNWDISDGYYLYQHRFAVTNSPEQAQVSELDLPKGIDHHDDYFGDSQIYRRQVTVALDLSNVNAGDSLTIQYQGCADAGLCYPPTEKVVYLDAVNSSANGSASGNDVLGALGQTPKATAPAQYGVDQLADNSGPATSSSLLDSLNQQTLLVSLGVFLLLGLGLAFTPCVFPMYPIISGIIVGQRQRLSTRRAFALSVVYVQGMALTYSILGVIVALAGLQYQAYLQHPVVLVVLALLFVLLALSMFGLYEIQLPARWQEKMNAISNKQSGGAYGGVFIMGAISGLVASPCTTAPLSAILLYIAQSGDVWVGASILYALSLGMGIPLIIFGTSGGKLLPKAGAWMNTVKKFFGVLLIAVALILLERFLNSSVSAALWVLFFVAAGLLLWFDIQRQGNTQRSIIAGLILLLGVAGGCYWQYQLVSQQQHHLQFTQVSDLADLQQRISAANADGQPVMLDLYADWCVACKEFEARTFSQTEVQQALQPYLLLQADVTKNNATNNELLQHYQVLGLPTIMFFDSQGNELSRERVTGFLDATDFTRHLEQLPSAN